MSPFVVLTALATHQGVRIQFTPPVGKTYHFRMKMDMTMAMSGTSSPMMKTPMTMGTSSDITMKVVKRQGDVTTIESTVGDSKVTGSMAAQMGNLAKSMSGKKVESQVGTDFKVRGQSAGQSPFTGALGNLSFPNHPVHVGESWTQSISLSKMMGAMGGGASSGGDLPFTFTFKGVENRGGEKVAVLAIAANSATPMKLMGQSVEIHLNLHGSALIDLASGMYRDTRMVGDIEFGAKAQGTMKQHMEESLTRI
jgi:hypothetical protein